MCFMVESYISRIPKAYQSHLKYVSIASSLVYNSLFVHAKKNYCEKDLPTSLFLSKPQYLQGFS